MKNYLLGQKFLQIQNETLQILELCERARYAPVSDVSQSELLRKTEDLIEKIEKETKK